MTDIEKLRERVAGLTPEQEQMVEALKASGLDKALLALGEVEWGATSAKSDGEHVDDFARSLALTREHFKAEGPQAMQGVYLKGTETVLCHTGTSPNSAAHARLIVGFLNHARALLSALKDAGT